MKNTNISILPLLKKSELSEEMGNNIFEKLKKIIFTIENIHNEKNISIDRAELICEIKSTAKVLIKKSDKFQKDIVSSTLKQTEEALETIEISKLRIEAQLKDLKKKEKALITNKDASFFSIFRSNISKIFKFYDKIKYSKQQMKVEQTMNNYMKKLSNYDLEKNKISQNFYENGSKKLELLRKDTYKILCTSKYTVSNEAISSLKKRIEHLC